MEKEAMLYRGAGEDKVSRKTDSPTEKRQRNIVMIVVTLTILSFAPIILAAYAGYDMG
jgi:hypothetical protein